MAKRRKQLAAPLPPIPGYDPIATAADGEWYDAKAADRAIAFFASCLRHIEGKFAGQPFDLLPPQKAIIGNMFGWKRADGTRRYRECFMGIPRGNGKTPLAAGIGNYLFFADQEEGCVGFITASTVEQAGLCFRHVHGQINREPELKSRCKVNVSQKSIIKDADRSAVFRIVSAEDGGAIHGGVPHFWIMDEIHAWGCHGPDAWEAIRTSFAKTARRQPMLIGITTRDYDRPSVCNEMWTRAEKVRDGVIKDSSFLPVIYAADAAADWTSETVWADCNPGLDVTVDRVSLRKECEEAKSSTSAENSFKRLHLNMKTGQDVRWLTLADWDACAVPQTSHVGQTCYAAIDLSAVKDVTALTLAFPDGDGGVYFEPYFWMPEERAQLATRRGEGDYMQWADDGWVNLTPGNVVDYSAVRAKVKELGALYQFQTIGIDPWGANNQAILGIRDDGFTMFEHRQGFQSMSEPSKHLERLLVSRKVKHDGNPCMRWMVSNVAAEIDPAGNIKPSKKKSAQRIDGVVAAVMAVGMMLASPEPASVYDDESARPGGLLTL